MQARQSGLMALGRDMLGRALSRAFSGAGEGLGSMLFPSWQMGPRLGAAEMLRAYSTMPWLRAFNDKISHDVGTTTWQVFVPTGRNGKAIRDAQLQRATKRHARTLLMKRYAKQDNLREISSHPMLDMLGKGNEWFSGLTSMQLAQQHLDLVGETAWILSENGLGMPETMVPIPPTWVMALPRENGGSYRVVGPGATYDVPERQMFWAYHPNPANPFRRGVGLSQVLADELETDEYTAKHVKSWFKNRAIPPVLISGLGVGIEELKRLEEKWLAKYNRVGAGWLPHFVGKKIEVHQLSQTFESMQLGELRGRQRDMIRQVYGIPPEIMGDVKDSNRATIDTADFIYQSRVIVPRLEFLRAAMQERLVVLYDERLVLDYVNPVAEDREFMLKVRSAAPWAWMADEWREMGLSDELPKKAGKVHAIPFNLALVRDLGAAADTQESLAEAGALAVAPAGAKPDDEAPTAGGTPEKPPAKALAKADPKDARKVADAARAEVLARAGQPVIRSLVGHFGQDTLSEARIDIVFDMADPAVAAHLRQWSAERVVRVNDTTKEAIRETLAEGFERGDTYRQLVRRIQAVFERASRARARNIATTETTRSSSFGAWQAMQQAGLEDKEWLSVQDTHVRDNDRASHVQLDGQRQRLDDPFTDPVNGAEAQYPGDFGMPEEDCNCRCSVITALAQRSHRLTYWKALDASRRPYMRHLRQAMQLAFRQQERAVLAALEAVAGRQAA